jgi:putative serine protease PepD
VSRLLTFLAGLATAGVLFGALAIAGAFDDEATTASGTPAESAAAPQPRAAGGSIADLYERVSPAVVHVTAQGGGSGRQERSPFEDGPRRGAASGSGFLISGEGDVVTNQHVVAGAERVRVRFGENDSPIDARLLGEDASSDLALLRIDPDDLPDGVEPLELGTSEDLRTGEAAIAIGSPFGLEGTVTTGVVSGVGRDIRAPNGFTISEVVQTDAAINPGNSGGPLLDGEGRVIGVNAQIATAGTAANSGVGFAVPIDTVREVVPTLRENGSVERAYLGVTTRERPQRDGAVVVEAADGGPADDAGIRGGDRIVAVGDQDVREPGELAAAVSARRPGETVEIRLVRDGEEQAIEVELGERPDEAPAG